MIIIFLLTTIFHYSIVYILMTERKPSMGGLIIDKVLSKRDEAIAKKRADDELAKSQEQAQGQIPHFKIALAELINLRVPHPEVIDEDPFSGSSRIDLTQYVGVQYNAVQLTAYIPTEGDPVCVTISATKYPNVNEPKSLERIGFKIEVDELDTYLQIGQEAVSINSTKQVFDSSTNGIPNLWSRKPKYFHPATLQELAAYQSLIEILSQDGVTFEAKTQPIIKYVRNVKAKEESTTPTVE